MVAIYLILVDMMASSVDFVSIRTVIEVVEEEVPIDICTIRRDECKSSVTLYFEPQNPIKSIMKSTFLVDLENKYFIVHI